MHLPRTFVALLVLLSPCVARPQAELWRAVNLKSASVVFKPAHLIRSQLASIHALLRSQSAPWDCAEIHDISWQRNLSFLVAPVGPQPITLVEAGAGCARGAVNSAMWLVVWTGAHPHLIASPANFSGWFRSIEPGATHGFHDITIGWHMYGSETGITYLRFDGTSYQPISFADVRIGEDGEPRILGTKSIPSSR